MPFTRWEIKEALGHGGAQEIADRLGKPKSFISDVIAGRQRSGKAVRQVRVAIARKIGKPVDEVFEPVDTKSADDASDPLEAIGGSR